MLESNCASSSINNDDIKNKELTRKIKRNGINYSDCDCSKNVLSIDNINSVSSIIETERRISKFHEDNSVNLSKIIDEVYSSIKYIRNSIFVNNCIKNDDFNEIDRLIFILKNRSNIYHDKLERDIKSKAIESAIKHMQKAVNRMYYDEPYYSIATDNIIDGVMYAVNILIKMREDIYPQHPFTADGTIDFYMNSFINVIIEEY